MEADFFDLLDDNDDGDFLADTASDAFSFGDLSSEQDNLEDDGFIKDVTDDVFSFNEATEDEEEDSIDLEDDFIENDDM